MAVEGGCIDFMFLAPSARPLNPLLFRVNKKMSPKATKITLVLGDINVSDFIHKTKHMLTKYSLVGSSLFPYHGETWYQYNP